MGRNVDKTRDLVEVKPNPEKRYSKYKDLNSKVIKYAHLDTPEIHEEICDRIVNGQAITAICKLEHMPHLELVYKWSSDPDHPMFARYERAVRIRAERWVDEILAIADDTTNDLIVDEMGSIIGSNNANIQRARLRVDTRKWLAGKFAPKVYGDKMDINNNSTVNNQTLNLSVRTDEDLDAILEHLRSGSPNTAD